jgi:RNA polymerase sigma-70 factor (ECF subfamily)
VISYEDADTDELLRGAAGNDASAIRLLFMRHRPRLRKMLDVRIDPRLAARIDPSDVVQEALAEATRKLPEYLRSRPLPFYPWLRQIAWQRLVALHHRHIRVAKRSVLREQPWAAPLPDGSAAVLADRLASSGTRPSEHLVRVEVHTRVRAALDKLLPSDREVLVLRYLEQLSLTEIGAVLEIPTGTVKSRHFRALERLHALLIGQDSEE